MTKSNQPKQSRAERVLAFMAVGVVGLAIICIFITLISKAVGVNPLVLFEQIPMLALPIGALLIIALFITAATRRNRGQR